MIDMETMVEFDLAAGYHDHGFPIMVWCTPTVISPIRMVRSHPKDFYLRTVRDQCRSQGAKLKTFAIIHEDEFEIRNYSIRLYKSEQGGGWAYSWHQKLGENRFRQYVWEGAAKGSSYQTRNDALRRVVLSLFPEPECFAVSEEYPDLPLFKEGS